MLEREVIHRLWKQRQKSALATVVEVKGSAYRRPGAQMLLSLDGQSVGGINGGCRGVVQILIEPANNSDLLIPDETVAVVFEGQLGTRSWNPHVIERPHI